MFTLKLDKIYIVYVQLEKDLRIYGLQTKSISIVREPFELYFRLGKNRVKCLKKRKDANILKCKI